MDGSVGVKVFSFWISIGLPSAYCFAGMEVAIRKDPESGDVIRACKPADWGGFLRALEGGAAPADLLDQEERDQGELRDAAQ